MGLVLDLERRRLADRSLRHDRCRSRGALLGVGLRLGRVVGLWLLCGLRLRILLRRHRCLLRIRLRRGRSLHAGRIGRIALWLSALVLHSHKLVVPFLGRSECVVRIRHRAAVVFLLQDLLPFFLFLDLGLGGFHHLPGLLEFLESALVLKRHFLRLLPTEGSFIGALLGSLDRRVRTRYRGLFGSGLGLCGWIALLLRLRVRLLLAIRCRLRSIRLLLVRLLI